MVEELNIPTQKDLIKIPKDESANAVIIELKIKTWSEITKDETKKKNLTDPNGKVLEIKYDAAGIIRHDIFPIPERITTSSRYGRFCIKYNIDNYDGFRPSIGMKIKVFFDGDGRSSILIAK